MSADVSIEPRRIGHAALLYPGLSDARLYTYFSAEPPASEAALHARFTRQLAGSGRDDEVWLNWAVRKGEDYVGTTQITIYAEEKAYLAYDVFTAFQRQGIAVQACALTLAEIKRDYNVKRCHVAIDTRNTRSLALARRLGFEVDQIVMAAEAYKGVMSDEWHGSKTL